MATATYDLIASQTLGTAAASITFSSIAASWTDLRLVVAASGSSSSGNAVNLDINGGSINNGATWIYGNGASVVSSSGTDTYGRLSGNTGVSGTGPFLVNADFFSYANTTTYKSYLSTFSADANGSGSVNLGIGLWLSTSAITQLKINYAGTFSIGTTAQLYGIKAA